MYYVNLGLKGAYDATGNHQSDFGIFGNGTGTYGDQANVGLVNNLQVYGYWSGAEDTPGGGWLFLTGVGFQRSLVKVMQFNAWAVHPGDVSAVPVPGAVWLFGSALLGLLGFKRRGNIG